MIKTNLTQIAAKQANDLDIAVVCAFAEYLLTNCSNKWLSSHISLKIQLQQSLFPDGLLYSNEDGLKMTSNTSKSLLLKGLNGKSLENLEMVRPE